MTRHFWRSKCAPEDEADEPRLIFRTNVEDMVTVDSEHPLRFERGAPEGLNPM